MDEKLISYYNRELAYIRKMGVEFAEQYPKIAGRLKLEKGAAEDPHVSRLIESFAFLTSRIRQNLDDSYSELTEALMGVIYPDYNAPIPSMSIVSFSADDKSPKYSKIPKGEKVVLGEGEQQCFFKTCFDTDVFPCVTVDTRFTGLPYRAPLLPKKISLEPAKSVLKTTLQSLPNSELSSIQSNKIRFYISGVSQFKFKLYEYFLNNSVGIAIGKNHLDTEAVFLPPNAIKPCGFNKEDAAIHFDGRTSNAHQLLSEFFVFSEKFSFIDIELPDNIWEKYNDSISFFIYFNNTDSELIQGVDRTSLQIGCTPIVNLFEESIDGIPVKNLLSENKLKVSSSEISFSDIYKVDRVFLLNKSGQELNVLPFYGSNFNKLKSDSKNIYWHIKRENTSWQQGAKSDGTDTYIRLVDEKFALIEELDDWILHAHVQCTNRDLVDSLPFGLNSPSVDFYDNIAGINANCVYRPTSAVRPSLTDHTRWQLVTQLSLQSFSGEHGLTSLKSVLALYDFNTNKANTAIINGITNLKMMNSTARIIDQGRSAICKGTKVILEFDQFYDSGNLLFLFSAILNEFFAQLCSINSFTQLEIRLKQQNKLFVSWPPKTGRQELI